MGLDVQSFLGRDVKTLDSAGAPDWKAELTKRWHALGDRIFVVEPERPPTFRAILDECSQLVVVWMLVQTKGNFTYAANRIESSRRTIRRYFLEWRKANPRLIPMPFVIFLRWQEYEGRSA